MLGDWAYPASTDLWKAWGRHRSQQQLIPHARLGEGLTVSAGKECASLLEVSCGVTFTPKPQQLGHGLLAPLFLSSHPFFDPLN